MSKKTTNEIENLKNNFLFQASLGSKELFHSNILAWILEQQNNIGELEPLKVFIEDITGKEAPSLAYGDYPTFRIEREQQNIDLTIKWKDGNYWNLIFIENKMKSIPTKKQLDEYDIKIDKLNGTRTKLRTDTSVFEELYRRVEKKLLLTPFKNDVNSGCNNWVNITYEEHILNFLRKIRTIQFNNSDIELVIIKFIELIENQNLLLKSFGLGGDTGAFMKRAYDFYNHATLDDVRNIRLHDLILKLAHQKISNLIKEKLATEFGSYIVDDFKDLQGKKGTVYVSHNFSRSTGISDVKICVSGSQTIGLQLQGNSLKYVAENFNSKKGETNKLFSFQLHEKKLWFFDQLKNEYLSGNGRDKNLVVEISDSNQRKNKTSFNSYGLNFIYLNMDVSHFAQKSIGDLVDFICSETKRVLENIESYQPE